MSTIETLTGKVLELRAKVREENLARMAIEDSPRCQELTESIKRLTSERDSMFIDCTDSIPELEAAKKELMEEFKAQNLSEYQGITGKYNIKRDVNPNKVFHVIEGDYGVFMDFASMTQKALDELIEIYPERKKDLLDCIETTQKLSDLTFPSQA